LSLPPVAEGAVSSRRLSLGLRLSLLVAGTMLPLLLFAIGLIYVNHEHDREAAFERVLGTVRGIRLVVDSEMSSVVASLRTLALSEDLQRGDIERFRHLANVFVSQFTPESALVVADRDGRQLLNTRVAEGESLPPRRNQAGTEEIFRSGQPAFSRVFIGSVANKPIITVDVPVMRDGAVVYVLAFNPPIGLFQRTIEQQRPGHEWTMSIFDQDGVNFARIPNPDRTIGQRASPTLYAEMFKSDEAKIPTTSLEGVPLLTAFTRSKLTGWTVAAGIAEGTLTAPLWRTLAITTTIGAVLLLIGLTFAIGMARQIARGEALQALLTNELNHRVKNTLATVQSIAALTFRADSDFEEAKRKFNARIVALGKAHGLMSEASWGNTSVRNIAHDVMQPYATEAGRVHISGPDIKLPATQSLMLSMILHELATNALKHGALSTPAGKVTIDWQSSYGQMMLTWREHDGPPVQEPTRRGFGSRLIRQGLAGRDGKTEMRFHAGGVECVVSCPIEA
jgi:two-component sensor histidine kinase